MTRKCWKIETFSSKESAVYYSALCLILIQVGIGIILKSSQTGGKYAFSVSGSITISEFFKFLLSTIFFWRHYRAQSRQLGYESVPLHITHPSSARSSSSLELKDYHSEESDDTVVELADHPAEPRWSHLRAFWGHYFEEINVDTRYGFALLALLYALINNTIFVAYELADPGTISLTRSGVIFITALVMICTLGTHIAKIQWAAIIIQICGLVTTQYSEGSGTSYPITTYLILVFQVFLTSVAGVYNQALLKSHDQSLHAQNMFLYASGVGINTLLHITLKLVKADEPNFWSGYDSLAAILVIVSNTMIGLAITAVYKYADAVIKCLASAVATGILLFLSPILFGTDVNPLVIPGGFIVFSSSWLYMEAAPPKKNPTEKRDTAFTHLAELTSRWNYIVLGIGTVLTVLTVVFLECPPTWMSSLLRPASQNVPLLESPFKKTMAMVRWNSDHAERIPYIQKYKPLFHTLHLSMPNLLEDEDVPRDFYNLTHDSWRNGMIPYVQVARTMQLILDSPANSSSVDIEGLLFFHFDAWINPLDFAVDDFKAIWFPFSQDRGGGWGGPTFECMEDREKYSSWFPIDSAYNFQIPIMQAERALERIGADYVVNPQEWCTGWSDIYYFPRHLFADYIFLTGIFGGFNAFHELAIPTMAHIIDNSRRMHPSQSVLNRMHCWGGCCNGQADLHDIFFYRCGHKLNFAEDQELVDAHFDRVDKQAKMLGKPKLSPDWTLKADKTRWNGSLDQTSIMAYNDLIKALPKDEHIEFPERLGIDEYSQIEEEIEKKLPWLKPVPKNETRVWLWRHKHGQHGQ